MSDNKVENSAVRLIGGIIPVTSLMILAAIYLWYNHSQESPLIGDFIFYMDQTTHSIEHKETVITPLEANDTPTVLAYRVGQLEKALKESTQSNEKGIETLVEKMDKFASNFATKQEVSYIRQDLESKISEVKRPVWAAIGAIVILFFSAIGAHVFK